MIDHRNTTNFLFICCSLLYPLRYPGSPDLLGLLHKSGSKIFRISEKARLDKASLVYPKLSLLRMTGCCDVSNHV